MLRQDASPVNSLCGQFLFQSTHGIAVTADKSRISITPVDYHNMSDIQRSAQIRTVLPISTDRM